MNSLASYAPDSAQTSRVVARTGPRDAAPYTSRGAGGAPDVLLVDHITSSECGASNIAPYVRAVIGVPVQFFMVWLYR